jgi:hypothetical protein
MEQYEKISQDHPAAQRAAGEVSAPALHYAQPPRLALLRRWLRPGSPVFFLLVLALAGAASWGAWKLRLKSDEQAFHARVSPNPDSRRITFAMPPDSASLRHLARLPGPLKVQFRWADDRDTSAAQVLRGQRLSNIVSISFNGGMDVDPWLKELSRPECGLTALTELDLVEQRVTDAGLKELASPGSRLSALTSLALSYTQVTDTSVKELARPDCGLKALTTLLVLETPVTDAGVRALERARPGLTVIGHTRAPAK